jgi:hypothetical protein
MMNRKVNPLSLLSEAYKASYQEEVDRQAKELERQRQEMFDSGNPYHLLHVGYSKTQNKTPEVQIDPYTGNDPNHGKTFQGEEN